MNMIARANEYVGSGTSVGSVKWFDPKKGYGFICVPGMQKDVLLHSNVLFQFGRSTTVEGAIITCEISVEAGRYRVSKILQIEGAGDDTCAKQFIGREKTTFHPARTKWYSLHKGYGFAVAFGSTEDIFIGQEALRSSGLGSLETGEAISIAFEQRETGLVAIQVAPWQ